MMVDGSWPCDEGDRRASQSLALEKWKAGLKPRNDQLLVE
jgi:hypothetical protein